MTDENVQTPNSSNGENDTKNRIMVGIQGDGACGAHCQLHYLALMILNKFRYINMIKLRLEDENLSSVDRANLELSQQSLETLQDNRVIKHFLQYQDSSGNKPFDTYGKLAAAFIRAFFTHEDYEEACQVQAQYKSQHYFDLICALSTYQPLGQSPENNLNLKRLEKFQEQKSHILESGIYYLDNELWLEQIEIFNFLLDLLAQPPEQNSLSQHPAPLSALWGFLKSLQPSSSTENRNDSTPNTPLLGPLESVGVSVCALPNHYEVSFEPRFFDDETEHRLIRAYQQVQVSQFIEGKTTELQTLQSLDDSTLLASLNTSEALNESLDNYCQDLHAAKECIEKLGPNVSRVLNEQLNVVESGESCDEKIFDITGVSDKQLDIIKKYIELVIQANQHFNTLLDISPQTTAKPYLQTAKRHLSGLVKGLFLPSQSSVDLENLSQKKKKLTT